jgi:cell division protein FtsZ
MSLKIDIPESVLLKPRIVIFGIGGAGGNAINNMIRSSLEGVEFVAANTDAQSLTHSLAETKVQLGVEITKGLGAGSFPDRGRAAAEENIVELEKILEGANMVFIAAGMGGGTGTGSAPVIAKLARERDILTVGVVTKPFHFEGKYRMETAQNGIEELKKFVDTLIVIPNQNLFRIANEQTTFEAAFKMADDVLHAGVRGVTDLITMPGLVNLDFADIRTIMTKMGKAMMGTGEAEGENRALMACEAAISNPLLDDVSIKGAKGVLVNMTGGPDMTLFEADIAVNAIKKEVDPNANIIFGSAFNEDMKGKIRISVVATGIDCDEFKRETFVSNYEPSRFKVDEDIEEVNGDKSDAPEAGYFDPGVSAIPDGSQLEEVSDVNFKPQKTYSKEENTNYGEGLVVDNAKKSDKSDKGLTQINFFTSEETVNKESAKEEVIELSKKKVPKLTKTKKGVSGFSLFSFMNGSSDKKDKVEEAKVELSSPSDSLSNDFSAAKAPETKRESTSKEAEKKRRQFFSETIFDEDSKMKEVKFEEDILNVPAFFRRKK